MNKLSLHIASDGHIHTKYCNHAIGEMEDYVRAGIDKSFNEIIFLEHLEADIISPRITWLTEDNFDTYFKIGNELQKRYQDKINIKLGVEVGYNPHSTQQINALLGNRKWDKIGLSYHYLAIPHEPHLNLLSRSQSEHLRAIDFGTDKIISIYLDHLIQAVEEIPATCLCHLDAVLRHIPTVNIAKTHLKKCDELLDAVKMKGMDLEINTSGIDFRGEFFPSKEILSLALDKKIPLVMGSDAHKPEEIGRHFLKANAILQELY